MNFEFQNPTRFIFGTGRFSRLGEVVQAHETRTMEDTVRIIHDDNGFLLGRPPMREADMEGVLRPAL